MNKVALPCLTVATTTTTTMSLTPAVPPLLCLAECDSCAQALLADLERLDDDLTRIKGQLENASASASSYARLGKLEKAISETKVAGSARWTHTLALDVSALRLPTK